MLVDILIICIIMKLVFAIMEWLELKRKKAANKKRRDFYETERGKNIKKMYKNRAEDKKDLIERLMKLQTGNNLAEMEKETILNLLKRMK